MGISCTGALRFSQTLTGLQWRNATGGGGQKLVKSGLSGKHWDWTIFLFNKLLNSENQLAQLKRASKISYNCQVWLQNIETCGKYSPVKLASFVYFCIANGKALPLCGNVVTLFPA